MNRITSAVLTALFVIGGITVVAPAPAASAATSSACVTLREYQQVRYGWPKKRVHRTFGTRGYRVYKILGREKRHYRPCGSWSRWSYVAIEYKKQGAWRIWHKWRYIS